MTENTVEQLRVIIERWVTELRRRQKEKPYGTQRTFVVVNILEFVLEDLRSGDLNQALHWFKQAVKAAERVSSQTTTAAESEVWGWLPDHNPDVIESRQLAGQVRDELAPLVESFKQFRDASNQKLRSSIKEPT